MVNKSERKRARGGQSKAARVRKKDIRRVVCQAEEEEFQTDSRLDSYLHEKEREIYSSY